MTTTTALDVAKYIKSRLTPWGEVQLQKLVYYSQAWSLVWEGRVLFDDRIEAWKWGPVVRSLRYRNDDFSTPADAEAIPEEDRRIVDAVVAFYGGMNGSELSTRTHLEKPWLEARGETPQGEASEEEISRTTMLRFHTLQSRTADAPRRGIAALDASDAEVERVVREGEEIYRGALEILAR